MKAKEIKALAGELVQRLSSQAFVEKTGVSARKIRELCGREYWEAQFRTFFPMRERVSCAKVLEICAEPMQALADAPQEGWLSFLYDFGCAVIYPEPENEARFASRKAAAHLYFTVLQFLLDEERKVQGYERFQDFALLAPEEYERFEARHEYALFLRAWRQDYVYEVFRLNMEATDYKTLEHVAGVHHVAMFLARGLYDAGVPVDLALVSGAAAGHDIGKFGCKPGEAVPHMHYYYTDRWFNRHNITYIGHIAANHSTWDLEPERLSVESLVLIYADFCVKQERINGENHTRISSLKEAFEIILAKLESVDQEKHRRYKFVYSRLKDFHDYAVSLGVDTQPLDGVKVTRREMPAVSLRDVDDTVQSLVYMGVETNIAVMHRMSAARQFGNFLEQARSETDQHRLQAFLRIFDRYTAYTDDAQKRQTAAYLYELLMHRDGDIRVEAARLLGKTIAQFNFGYRKRYPSGMKNLDVQQAFDLWWHYLGILVRPDLKLNEVQKSRIQANAKNVLAALLAHATAEDHDAFVDLFMTCFDDPKHWAADESFSLLNAVFDLPLKTMSDKALSSIGTFALFWADSMVYETRVSAWRAMHWITFLRPHLAVTHRIVAYLEAQDVANDSTLTYLKYKMFSDVGMAVSAEAEALYGSDIVPDIFLDNLQTATPWIVKAVNIRLLSDQIQHDASKHRLHIAAHLSNLLKVNDIMVVPRDAGQAMSALFPLLRVDERNEVVMELVGALEVADARYSRYIPEYLARTMLWLPLAQLDEMIDRITSLLNSASDSIVMRALDTVGQLLRHFPKYTDRFAIDEEAYCHRRHVLLGAILKGMASYREAVRQEAMMVLADVFGGEETGEMAMSMEEKYYLFTTGCRKILFLLTEIQGDAFCLFARASAVSAISNFISLWRMDFQTFDVVEWGKVAFLPGTFDPFTRSHKEIVREIRDQGFEVYLAVDEFSWSKKAQPHLTRRKIVNMSVADEFHVNIFPYRIPINIANPKDLAKLKAVFKGREVYMVTGSDVVKNASSYKKTIEPHSIHTMNHIIFRRGKDKDEDIAACVKLIQGKVEVVDLPPEFRDISSTMLRENIDLNRDVSNLVDPMVQGFIYASGLYLREPEYKPLVEGKVLSFERVENVGEALLKEIADSLLARSEYAEAVLKALPQSGDKLIVLRNMMRDGHLTGVIRGRYVAPEALYEVLGDLELADQVRRNTSGKILLISGIYTAKDTMIDDPAQRLLTEVLADACADGCSYAMFFPKDNVPSAYIMGAVRRQGFVWAEQIETKMPVYLVDMRQPIVVLRNLQTFIKEPLVSEDEVVRVIERGYRDLQETLTALYPGELVLTLASEVILPRMVEKITAINQVPNEIITPRVLGNNMCVPFGRILRERVVPNTVTKTLHTDTVYNKDLSDYTVGPFAGYPPLVNQVRMLHSFDRPIILVDDIMNIGKRFAALDELLRQEDVTIRKMVFGVMTGVGRDRMAKRGVESDSVYYVPNLRKWYVESVLYPFLGGETVARTRFTNTEVSPSVNPILPYTDPGLPGVSREAMFRFSACCIKNARDIYYALEECYRARYGRNLTIERLAEVITVPSAPDRGECVNYDPNLAASVYLDNDLKMLERLQK